MARYYEQVEGYSLTQKGYAALTGCRRLGKKCRLIPVPAAKRIRKPIHPVSTPALGRTR